MAEKVQENKKDHVESRKLAKELSRIEQLTKSAKYQLLGY